MKTTLFAVCFVVLTATVAVMAQVPGMTTSPKEDWFTFPGKGDEPPLLIHMEAKDSRQATGQWRVTQLHCEVTFQDGIGEHQLDIDFAEESSRPRIFIRIRSNKYCVSLWNGGGVEFEFPANPALEGYSVSYGIAPVTTPVPAGEPIFCPAETRVKDEAINPDRVWEIISLAEGILAIGKTWDSMGCYEAAKSNLEPDARHLRRILNRGIWAVLKK